MKIDFDILVDVEYTVDENPSPGRLYPIDITSVKHGWREILSSMSLHEVLRLQRKVHIRELDAQDSQ